MKVGFSQIPNVFFDDWVYKMSDAELRVVLAIFRKTVGWHKSLDRISLSQLEEFTGLSRNGVLRGVKEGIAHGVIVKHKTTHDACRYSLSFPARKEKKGSAATELPTSAATALGVVQLLNTQKKELKETEIKEHTSYVPASDLMDAKEKLTGLQKKWSNEYEDTAPEVRPITKTKLYAQWDHLVAIHHKAHYTQQKDLTAKEKGWLRVFHNEVGAELAYAVMRWVIRNWADFALAIKMKTGDKLPDMPQTAPLAKHWDHAKHEYETALQLIAKPQEATNVVKFKKKQGFTPSGH